MGMEEGLRRKGDLESALPSKQRKVPVKKIIEPSEKTAKKLR